MWPLHSAHLRISASLQTFDSATRSSCEMIPLFWSSLKRTDQDKALALVSLVFVLFLLWKVWCSEGSHGVAHLHWQTVPLSNGPLKVAPKRYQAEMVIGPIQEENSPHSHRNSNHLKQTVDSCRNCCTESCCTESGCPARRDPLFEWQRHFSCLARPPEVRTSWDHLRPLETSWDFLRLLETSWGLLETSVWSPTLLGSGQTLTQRAVSTIPGAEEAEHSTDSICQCDIHHKKHLKNCSTETANLLERWGHQCIDIFALIFVFFGSQPQGKLKAENQHFWSVCSTNAFRTTALARLASFVAFPGCRHMYQLAELLASEIIQSPETPITVVE